MFELATCVTAHAIAAQVMVLKVPPVPHAAVPLPVYPTSQVTATVCSVVPVILPVVALFELATCVTAQASAAQVMVLKDPSVRHVAVPLPVYPAMHITVTVCPVVPTKRK